MAHPALRLMANRYALGLTDQGSIVDMAHRALNDGVYSYSLGELATTRFSTRADMAPWIEGTLRELDIPIPPIPDALTHVMAYYVQPVAEGSVPVVAGVARMYREVHLPLLYKQEVERDGELADLFDGLIYFWEQYEEYTAYWSDRGDLPIEALQPLAAATTEVERMARDWCLRYGRPKLHSIQVTHSVYGLATTVRHGGRFELLPILADALEEAGCVDHDVLDHCRGNDPHVLGCWVVDLLLELPQSDSLL